MNAPRILVVDDEPQIHRFLRPALEMAGYVPERAETGAEALRQARLRPPAAVLLDLGLPDLDGQEVLRQLRTTLHVPILVVSARDRMEDKLRALDEGADDYIDKPFDMAELLARLRACLRRALVQDGVTEPWRAEGLEVDLLRRTVALDGVALGLTPREYELLAVLVRHAGRVVTHRQLLTAVWGPGHAEQLQYLRVHLGNLRQKLGPAGMRLIRTENHVGYRLVTPEA